MNTPSKFLQWDAGMHELADGVFAFVQPNGIHGNAGHSNAGLIVGPDHCVVIDTLGTNSMHDAFLSAIRRVTDKPVGRVLLTHHHVDHILGTHRFLPACVISHRACRANIVKGGANAAERWAAKRPHFAHDLLEIPVVVPDLTFDDRVYLHLGERELVFFHPGLAHTDGDAVAWLPSERIVFAGDLFFNRVCPAAFAGSLTGWIAVVRELLEMKVDTFVPGHGPVSGKEDLAAMLKYLETIDGAARSGYTAGLSAECVARDMDLGDFREWADTEERLLEDVRRVYLELSNRE
ncbi:cyclase [Acidovorax delafieldii]|uniref:MBL fold metallo-hydrolase n=1 Tax=Acidovorax delafieldii TaxID=47920 RepID=UPI00285C1551|nr:MBL fold metallo-hydrolase [Acidovorax delafieldii]MDR6155580.1 cyclase [Acidovorax delafieldii]